MVNNHETFLKKNFNIAHNYDNSELPHMYWLPKLHKNPSKRNFIVAATKCFAKPLSETATSALNFCISKLSHTIIKKFHFSGVKTFLPIQSNNKIIQKLISI